MPLTAEARQHMQVSVLFVFDTGDNLVGDPEAARVLVQDMPDVRVEVVEARYLMGAEVPQEVNSLIIEFTDVHPKHAVIIVHLGWQTGDFESRHLTHGDWLELFQEISSSQ